MTRPKFSDLSGRIELKKEQFQLPAGYAWEGEWNTKLQTGPEAGREGGVFREVAYEHESRVPGGDWEPATPHYIDKASNQNYQNFIGCVKKTLKLHLEHWLIEILEN